MMTPKKSSRKPSGINHRSTLSLQKTEVVINVYDLLPPGRFSSLLWTIGTSLLHSGVVINDKEYAFGGHDKHGMSGVYWTKPRTEPPGGTFKCEILQGFTLAPQDEIDRIIKEASEAFHGTAYNLLNKNCNHFTSYLCEKLTGRPGPGWLNRAASIGVALPCVVPKEWIAPPEYETADGELLDEEEDIADAHERSRMLRPATHERRLIGNARDDAYSTDDDEWDSEEERRHGGSGKGKGFVKDSSGRALPSAERAPRPHRP